MQKKHKMLLIGVLILVLVLSAVFSRVLVLRKDGYSVVYATTGEIYVGKLSVFPNLELRDGYIFQVQQDKNDPSKNSFQLQPMSEAVWAPKSLSLVRENIIFYGKLDLDSQIAKTLAAQIKK